MVAVVHESSCPSNLDAEQHRLLYFASQYQLPTPRYVTLLCELESCLIISASNKWKNC